MALSKITADSIAANAVSATMIADGSITNAKLGSDIDASKLVAGSLPIARIADGAIVTAKIADANITAGKLAANAAVSNIGYYPAQGIHNSNMAYATATGGVWLRVASLMGRWPYRVTVVTTGGWYSPGSTSFYIQRSWSNDIYVGGTVKLAAQYCTQVRATGATADQDWYLEVYFNGISSSSGNGSTLFDGYSSVKVEALGAAGSVYGVQLYASNGTGLGYTSTATVL